MLVYFSAENFRSFKEPLELNMRAAPRLQRHGNHTVTVDSNPSLKLLRTAVIYGANASGKSNMIKAMDFAKKMISGDFNNRNKIAIEPFKLSSEEQKDSTFYFEFYMAKKCYAYGFKLDNSKILEESLYVISKNDFCIFERTYDGENYSFKTDFKEGEKDVTANILSEYISLIKYTSDNKLFLTEMYNKKIHHKLDVIGRVFFAPILFFTDKLIIIFPESKYGGISSDLGDGTSIQNNYIETLKKFDTGIDTVELEEVQLSRVPEAIIENVTSELNNRGGSHLWFKFDDSEYIARFSEDGDLELNKIVSFHKLPNGKNFKFDLSEESDGTKRLLDLLPALCVSDDDMKMDYSHVYVIDEFDRSLHPNLSKSFLSTFLDGNVSVNQDQLIVTTHEAGLLDNNLLRRDEIWFVQKEHDQSSHIYSLNDYSVRFDKDIQKAYLSGKFGAVPYLMADYVRKETTIKGPLTIGDGGATITLSSGTSISMTEE